MSNEVTPTIPLKNIFLLFATPILLGMAPVLGKLAIEEGADPFAVAAIRTILAAGFLWGLYFIFARRFIYIYPAGLMGCVVIGVVNGIGSLFYYSGLGLLEASLVQLINGMYLAFAVLLSRVGGQKADLRTLLRVMLALIALFFLTDPGGSAVDWMGIGLMLGSALMFAGTLILSQYVLYEMPTPTATLYILTTMAVVVTMVWLAVGEVPEAAVFQASIWPILALGVTTALSRLAMFSGVKLMGGMQTAILALAEIAVALLLAFIVLGEDMSQSRWIGTIILFVGILLIRQRDLHPRGFNPNALIVANMSSVQFQRIAFHRAFGTSENDDDLGTMANITTGEMIAIQKMMGAQSGAIDPYPIGRHNGFADSEALEKLLREAEAAQQSGPDAGQST